MGSVEVFTKARMLAIENSTIVDGEVDGDGHLILKQRDGTPVDAGDVRAPNLDDASTTTKGIVQLATGAETIAGTESTHAVTPAGLQLLTATEVRRGIVRLATEAEALAGTDNESSVTPEGVKSVVDSAVVSVLSALPNRNLIINGNFRINQRSYFSNTALLANQYSFDRWKAFAAGAKLTFTPEPQGQVVTISEAAIIQVVERAHVPAGRYVLSWKGTAPGLMVKHNQPQGFGVSPFVYDHDGLDDLDVLFGEGTLSEVQLERGSTPTPYEWTNITDELTRCKRYFQIFEKISTTIEFNVLNPYFGVALGSGYLYGIPLTPPMRVAPKLYHPHTPTNPNCGFDFDYYNASGAVGRYVSFTTSPYNIKPYYSSGNNGGATLPAVAFRGRAQLAIWVDAEL